jgi:hypothetical protein
MPQSSANNKRYYTQFPKDLNSASYLVGNDSRLQWDALYGLKDAQINVVQLTLTNNSNIDATLTANSPTLFILSQDTVGGWTPTFVVNSDNSLKFLGTTSITWVTTANTYTTLLFWATTTNKAYLVSYLSGGNLV